MTAREGLSQHARQEWEVGERALRLAVLTLPHLAGLARRVRLAPDYRHQTAAVFASGRIVYNPHFLAELGPADAAFIMAHELMHLALHTHRRGEGADRYAVNVAHDYIINDMLVQAFGRPVPGGGLALPGARQMSLERLLGMLGRGELQPPGPEESPGGDGGEEGPRRPPRPLHGGLRRDELFPPSPPRPPGAQGDVLDEVLEREWFPGTSPKEQERCRAEAEREGAKAISLGALGEVMAAGGRGTEPGGHGMFTEVLRGYYHTPWEVALQKWMEFVAPADRTFARPSRRGADRADVVLPGRNRVGWTLHIILDTSGSMTGDLPRALGAIASFCESVGVWQVRLMQCDTTVTADDFVEPERLADYEVRGLGGSDMSPALRLLAEDPEVEAVVVLTDGDIEYPPEPMPYQVLWGVMTHSEDANGFAPPYGQVLPVSLGSL